MATITGFTAERMLEIENGTVVNGTVVGTDLFLIRHDGSQVNVGQVTGPEGPVGPMAEFAGYEEPINDKGNVSGAVSIDFNTHNVWRINPTGNVTISWLNLPPAGFVQNGTLIVANSNYAITWPVGTKFPATDPLLLDGETIISMMARQTFVTVGIAWSGVS